jgi:hypothetical protein
MKKLIAISILVLIAGAVFAQDGITIQAWGRGAFTPLQIVTAPQVNGEVKKDTNGDDMKDEVFAGSGVTWGSPDARVDFRVVGNSEFAGFQIHSNAEGGSLANGDNGAHVWVKPFGNDLLKLTAGWFLDDTLRGKIGNLDGGFSNFVLYDFVPEEDAIFNRFGTGNVMSTNGQKGGFMISSAPVEGLFFGLLVPGAMWNEDGSWTYTGPGTGTLAGRAYQYMQIGAGYNIDGIGHIRAQYIGGWSGVIDMTDEDTAKYYEAKKPARIEVAFALTAVENLLVDLGAKIWLEEEMKDTNKTSNGLDFSLGAHYGADAFGIGARVDISGIGAYDGKGVKDDDSENGALTIIRLVPSFNLDFATIGIDFALAIKANNKAANGDDMEDGWNKMGFGAFIQKGFGNGGIKVGMSYTLPENDAKEGKAQGSGVFQIPIILEYAFF